MKIISDFRETYDCWSNNKGVEFYRISTSPPYKKQQLDIIGNAGFWVVPHGSVENLVYNDRFEFYNKQGKQCYEPFSGDLSRQRGKIHQIVLYEDERQHCGEGKKLLSICQIKPDTSNLSWCNTSSGKTYHKLSSYLCSAFIPNSIGKSVRLLQIGNHSFWIEMWSNKDWRSNVGDGDCKIIGIELEKGPHEKIHLPIWAIDFVYGDKEFLGIDFNICPGTKIKGLNQYISSKEIFEQIENYIIKNEQIYKKYLVELGIKI